jgi:hypothetical protein
MAVSQSTLSDDTQSKQYSRLCKKQVLNTTQSKSLMMGNDDVIEPDQARVEIGAHSHRSNNATHEHNEFDPSQMPKIVK